MENLTKFENFIIKTCRSSESGLRKFLKHILEKNGFSVQEDTYESHRKGHFAGIHNMLAIRGTNPKVCLVAHTDVCRDHRKSDAFRDVVPVIKEVGGKRIIQDKTCETQVGGDDRLGVAINTWIALNSSHDMGLLFTTDEEIGLCSAEEVAFPELMKFDLLAQVDRGNHSNQLVTNIGGEVLCSPTTKDRLLKVAKDIGLPRSPVQGLITDVYAIKKNGRCREAVNMTCGYHNSWGTNPSEFINIEEAVNTKIFVENIIEDYNKDFLFSEEKYNQEKGLSMNKVAKKYPIKEGDFVIIRETKNSLPGTTSGIPWDSDQNKNRAKNKTKGTVTSVSKDDNGIARDIMVTWEDGTEDCYGDPRDLSIQEK